MTDVPYTIEQDENGAWCARAQLALKSFAYGSGDTADEAVADLREGIEAYLLDFTVDIHTMAVNCG